MTQHSMYRNAIAALALLLLAADCGPGHIAPYERRQRTYKPRVPLEDPAAAASPGSLWSPAAPGNFLFNDARAFRKGDLLLVRVQERADARRGAATDLARSGGIDAKLDAFLALVGEKQVKAGLESTFSGQGETRRSEYMEATVEAMVVEVLPNGNLFIEGQRVVLVNEEEQHFYISGLVRPEDVQADNSVTSSLIADAEIEFTGRGVVTDKQRPGWLHRGMDYISPF